MRILALLTTTLGILLHALLGWCPQHVGCGAEATAKSTATAQHHHRCKGDHHRSQPDSSGTSTNRVKLPFGSESHDCDHADCLVVSQAGSVQGLAPLALCEYLPLSAIERFGAVELAAIRSNADRSFLSKPQGQAARIARGVWLI